jgi:DNA-binding PadR family transcriptional regulator
MDDIANELPLRQPTLYILLSLAPGAKHGYAIMAEVEALSEGQVRLSTGTLYGAISRMLDDGWIVRVDDPLPSNTRRGRKAYALSEKGWRILRAETERLRRLVTIAQTRSVGVQP